MLGHPFSHISRQSPHFSQALSPKKASRERDGKAENLSSTILVERNKISVHIPVQNILFIKSEHVYCRIFFTNHQQVLQRISLEKFLARLPQDRFLRVHRSYIVNVEHIRKFNSKKIFIGETVITIGRSWRDRVIPKLQNLLSQDGFK